MKMLSAQKKRQKTLKRKPTPANPLAVVNLAETSDYVDYQ
jgi:hypothetical protein